MARITDAKCKLCRRQGEKLFLKGERCFSPKCAMVKRPYPPGIHGKKRRRGLSEYGRQLSEKQRIKRIYGILERQMKKYFLKAQSAVGDTRENLLRELETRLDNVIFRLGWASSRAAARQMISHGLVLVNRRGVDVPSFQVRKGQSISLKERVRKTKQTEELAVKLKKYETPAWLKSDADKMEAQILALPQGSDLGDLAPVGLIVEFYSR